jgi:endonuclease/exonuclease/phosphatase family metal-dependent hydrolase
MSGSDVMAAARAVVVASYNVHGCVGTDRKRNVGRVARVLRELHADVIALQEIDWYDDGADHHEPADLMAELPGMRALWAPTCRRRGGALFGNALLTSLPVRSVSSIDLTWGRREPRTALDVELDAGTGPLRVIATHLGLRPRERRFQVQRILEHAGRDDRATVLLGDINEWFIAGRPLRWLHAHFGFVPHLRTFPASFPVFALDRIWVHPPRAIARVWCHVTPASRHASDHLPVLARLQLGV